MTSFQDYLHELASHEDEKINFRLTQANIRDIEYSGIDADRIRILRASAFCLDWMGDFFANPEIIWDKRMFQIDELLFSGTDLEWNEILLKQSERKPEKLRALIQEDPSIREILEKHASYGDESIVVRPFWDSGKFTPIDGMHRFVGAILQDKTDIEAWYPTNFEGQKPFCMPSTVYDLIRGYQRNAKDEAGKLQLKEALLLLCRVYANVPHLLRVRFDDKHVADEEVQEIIADVLNNY